MLNDRGHPEIVVLTGIPGSGKSTLAKSEFGNYLRINLDTVHSRRKEEQLLSQALSAGQSVVIDNTNTTVASRKRYIDLGRKYSVRVRSVFVDCPVEVALERNEKRLGKEKVPAFVVRIYAKRLAVPNTDEGFDSVTIRRAS